METTWIDKITIALCLLAIGGGACLRFAGIGDQIYHNDEAWTGLWLSGHNLQEMQSDLCGRISDAADFRPYLRLSAGKGIGATISAVATDDPKQGPIYYGLLRAWADLAGDSSSTRRTLSILIGLLLYPLVFLLARELFDSHLAGWIVAALIAASPAQVLYSQDIRPYSLFAATVLFSSWALSRALRSEKPIFWHLYTGTVIVGLYSHPLFILVIGSHAAYAIFPALSGGGVRTAWSVSPVRAFVRAILFGVLAFAPWTLVFAMGWRRGLGGMKWLLNPIPFRYLVESWMTASARTFVDLTELHLTSPPMLLYLTIVGLVVFSFVQLWMNADWHSAALPLLLFVVPFLVLASADLVLRGQSSSVDRYFIAAYLGAELGVAHLLTTAIRSKKPVVRGSGVLLFCALLMGGTYSTWLNSQTNAPWIKGPARDHRQMARVVNDGSGTLLVCDCPTIVRLLAFSPFLHDDVQVALLRQSDRLAEPGGGFQNFGQIFLFRGPVGSELDGLFPVEPVAGTDQLWRLKKTDSE